jgi:hypothetical protein
MLNDVEQPVMSDEETESRLDESLDAMRAELRQEILINALLHEGSDLVFEAEFSGYGDSGDYHPIDNEKVDQFFSELVYKLVTFDWYNNEGGGGSIVWDVKEDVITISGYQNEVVRNDVMELEI